jgi:hypothetical protein
MPQPAITANAVMVNALNVNALNVDALNVDALSVNAVIATPTRRQRIFIPYPAVLTITGKGDTTDLRSALDPFPHHRPCRKTHRAEVPN